MHDLVSSALYGALLTVPLLVVVLTAEAVGLRSAKHPSWARSALSVSCWGMFLVFLLGVAARFYVLH
jgi:hypothetical protein